MADKSFGVKELNLLNASGTPTVTSPNNLNLNANTVAISTSCTIGNNLTVTSTTNSANLNVTGIGTLTRGFATDLSVSGISTISQPSNANPHSLWDVVNNGSSAYRFTGPGQSGDENNPNIYLVRGQRYIFKVNASGHPFQLRVANGGAAYSDGVTNNGAQSGNVVINVQHDAPAQLYYQCTNHGSMVGNIYIVGGPQVISGVVTATTFVGNLTGNVTGTASANAVLTGSTNNTLVTVTGANAITGESTLTYNGSDTFELQPASATPAIFIGDSNRTGAGQGLAQFRGNWNGTTVARITFDTGDDTTNKDDGIIRFDTSSTGSLVERVRINRSGYLGIGNVTSPDDKVEIRTCANDQGVLIKSTGSTSNAIKFDANRSGANQGLGSIKARWNGTTVAQIFMNTGDDTTDKNDGYIIFGTESAASNGNANATERARITSTGNFGINTSSPSDKLHVNGGDIIISTTNAPNLRLVKADNSTGSSTNRAFFGIASGNNNFFNGTVDNDLCIVAPENGRIHFGYNNSIKLRMENDGTLFSAATYNNTTASGSRAVVMPNNTGEFFASTSSRRFKTNITTLTDALADKILECRPVSFNSTCDVDNKSKIFYGLIAEEVHEIDTSLVAYEDENAETPVPAGVQYDRFVPHLINLVKRQKAQIEALETRIAALEGS